VWHVVSMSVSHSVSYYMFNKVDPLLMLMHSNEHNVSV
jgi:hypothetical protein